MPKLLQLNVTANWGSTGKIAADIGNIAIKYGWESVIAYGRYMNPTESKLFKVGSKRDTYFHYVQQRLFEREGLGSKNPTKRLVNWIKEYNPDIIHLHNIHDHWLNYPILFKYLSMLDTPIVWTFHDCWAFTGGCAYFDKVGCHNWETGCIRCPMGFKHSARNHSLRQDNILPIMDRLTIVPVSNWLAEFVKGSILKDCNIKTIHNGININKFVPHTGKKKVVLGVALPWSDRKGLPDMFQLRELLPDDFEIRLIGLSKKQIMQLPAGITGYERTQSVDELARHYSEAIAFVNPTYEDNFPTVNLEALACGTPVITYRTGGSPEAIDKDTGIVVEKGDRNGLANAIMRVVESTDRYNQEDCRARAVKEFDKDNQFGKYIDLYTSLLT